MKRVDFDAEKIHFPLEYINRAELCWMLEHLIEYRKDHDMDGIRCLESLLSLLKEKPCLSLEDNGGCLVIYRDPDGIRRACNIYPEYGYDMREVLADYAISHYPGEPGETLNQNLESIYWVSDDECFRPVMTQIRIFRL